MSARHTMTVIADSLTMYIYVQMHMHLYVQQYTCICTYARTTWHFISQNTYHTLISDWNNCIYNLYRCDYDLLQMSMLLSNKILFTGCYFVTFISFVHRPSHILCVFLTIPLYCMHVRMPHVLIKELTYLLTCTVSLQCFCDSDTIRGYLIIKPGFGFIVNPDLYSLGKSNGLLAVNKQQWRNMMSLLFIYVVIGTILHILILHKQAAVCMQQLLL